MYIDSIKNEMLKAQKNLSLATTEQKNQALCEVSKSIDQMRDYIKKENKKDIKEAIKSQMSEAMIDRLTLDDKIIDSIIEGINTVISNKDPIGRSKNMWTVQNGLVITKLSIPIGVIAIIYEGRPNVTADAFALALKSSNAVILRGSSSAINSNAALEKAIKKGLENSQISQNIIHLVKDSDRKIINQIMTANGFVDLLIPRGGQNLIDTVVKNATVPTLQTGTGNNHIFVDKSADLNMAVSIVKNAKLQRPGTCNAAEKLLVHKDIAKPFLKRLYDETKGKLNFHTDAISANIIKDSSPLKDEELSKEYLDFVIGVKVVDDIFEAMDHIDKYSSGHSEAIITNDLFNANIFKTHVDAAAVYVNASTRFTDGGQFGFGLEMGISTQKMHARGPVGLNELVTYKYIIEGNGHIRN